MDLVVVNQRPAHEIREVGESSVSSTSMPESDLSRPQRAPNAHETLHMERRSRASGFSNGLAQRVRPDRI